MNPPLLVVPETGFGFVEDGEGSIDLDGAGWESLSSVCPLFLSYSAKAALYGILSSSAASTNG